MVRLGSKLNDELDEVADVLPICADDEAFISSSQFSSSLFEATARLEELLFVS